jgi:dolichol kinase
VSSAGPTEQSHGTTEKAHTLRPWTQEIARKSVHIVFSLSATAIVWYLPTKISRIVFCSAAVIAVIIDVARFRVTAVERLFARYFAPLLRSHEIDRITGATTLALGVAVVVLLFPKNFAIAGLLYAGLGDAAGALVGRSYGRHRFPWGKSLEGSIAFFCVAIIVGWLVPGIGFRPALLAALAVTPIEAAPLSFDDNLIIPICGAAATWGATLLVG